VTYARSTGCPSCQVVLFCTGFQTWSFASVFPLTAPPAASRHSAGTLGILGIWRSVEARGMAFNPQSDGFVAVTADAAAIGPAPDGAPRPHPVAVRRAAVALLHHRDDMPERRRRCSPLQSSCAKPRPGRCLTMCSWWLKPMS